VIGSHDISVIADAIFPDFNADTNTVLILPGGPGTSNYKTNEPLLDYLRNHYTAGGKVAAICAAPTVLGTLGILEGKKACCYPGFEHELLGADICDATAIVDGNIITGRSAGASIEFALAVLTEIKGKITADTVREKLVM
jgi:4-methyl-5(b-hydroxyethyl)-thiazole monophosphate biosynthesis